MGAVVIYPAVRKFMKKSDQYQAHMSVDMGIKEAGGSIELAQGDKIHYYFPLEHREEFYLTTKSKPEYKEIK